MKNDFGYTNDPAELAKVIAFREAAIADGWTLERVYDHEPADSYGKLTKGDFVMHANCRDKERMKEWGGHRKDEPYKYRYQCAISIWGPDRLAIHATEQYSWSKISEGLTTCSECNKIGVPTKGVGFAGRVCESCLPAARAAIETRGWND